MRQQWSHRQDHAASAPGGEPGQHGVGSGQPRGGESSRREGVAGSGGLGLLSLKSARTPSGGQASGVTSRGPCSP